MELDLLSLTTAVTLTAALALGLLPVAACGGGAPPATSPRAAAASATPVTTAPEATAPAPVAGAVDGAVAATAAAAPTNPSAAEGARLPLPAGTRVLHIGDSMAGALGVELNRQLEAQGIKGTLRCETSSFIPTWAWGEALPRALGQLKPDLVIITLGMNELKIEDPGRRAKTIRRLVDRLGERPCVWISPPPLASGTNDLVAIIRANCAPCAFMNTDEIYPDMPRLGDQIHPTYTARAEWARRVIDWLAEHRAPHGDLPWEFEAGVVGPMPAGDPPG